ncbi:MAG: hypothetical protein PHE73_08855 [Sulfurovaceae bacterium]|nr:hypothetical protein [Sulfurovaceae bacterium]
MSVEIPPIGRINKNCPPPKKCAECIRPVCQNIIFIAKKSKPQKQISLEMIETHVMGDIKAPDYMGNG